jgi:TetR/AcrR family transcriptional repressor of nem operon
MKEHLLPKTISDAKNTKARILKNTKSLILLYGNSTASLEQIGKASNLTKGGIFHHFASKDELTAAALDAFWEEASDELSKYLNGKSPDPLKQLIGSIEFFEGWIAQKGHHQSCLIGTVAQEVSGSNAFLRGKCAQLFENWIDALEVLIKNCVKSYKPKKKIVARELAEWIVCSIEGAILLAKCTKDRRVYKSTISQLNKYLKAQFIDK